MVKIKKETAEGHPVIYPGEALVKKKKKTRIKFKNLFKFSKNKIRFRLPLKERFSFKSFKILLRTVLIFIIILFVIFSAGIYFGGWQGKVAGSLAKYVPYPAFYVNGEFVSLEEMLSDTQSIKKYYERLGLPANEAQLEDIVIKSLLQKRIIKKLANDQGISVSQEEVNSALADIVQTEEDQAELADYVNQLYGWSWDEYLDKVVTPSILASKVEENYYTSGTAGEIKQQLQDYYDELAEDSSKFGEIASTLNDDDTRYVSGDLGWFSLGDTVPEFEAAVVALSVGEISPVIQTRFGFHIINLLDKVIDESGQTSFRAAHIFKQVQSFGDYLDDEVEQARTITFIKIQKPE